MFARYFSKNYIEMGFRNIVVGNFFMKAVFLSKYGSPEFIQVKEIKIPKPNDDEVRIKVLYASINASDFEFVKGTILVRLFVGLRNPRPRILGSDFSGIVDAVGSKATQFKIGDEVFADLPFGAFAEFLCIPESKLRIKPPGMSFEQASTIGEAGVLALQGIRGKNPPQSNQTVLINGAGGGVGTFAIQIAKYYGTIVTCVDEYSKFDLMRSLGADHVIDYKKKDFTKIKEKFDLIVDIKAKKSPFAFRKVLKKNGVYRMVGGTTGRIFQTFILGSLLSMFSSKSIGILIGRPNNKEDMEFLTKLFEDNKVVPIIDKIYSLDEVSEAIRYLGEGKTKGKLVIRIN
jgi:NADPH:quinone reductase-like Zn-dependent oxidoreductase